MAAGNNYGLEVTKATRQEFEADLTRLDRKQKTKHYSSDPTAGAMDLSVAGWVGNALKTEWAEYGLASIADKLQDIDRYSVSGCDLLIYDNTPTGAPDLNVVAEALRLKFSGSFPRSNNGRRFGVVSVIRDPWLIYNIAGPYRIAATSLTFVAAAYGLISPIWRRDYLHIPIESSFPSKRS